MKFSTPFFSLSLIAISPSLACLHTYGHVSKVIFGSWSVTWAGATDNGVDICDTEWGAARIDQDGHFSIPCIGNYVYAFTQDGKTAWYSNGINGFRFVQTPIPVGTPGFTFEYTWQEYNFGC